MERNVEKKRRKKSGGGRKSRKQRVSDGDEKSSGVYGGSHSKNLEIVVGESIMFDDLGLRLNDSSFGQCLTILLTLIIGVWSFFFYTREWRVRRSRFLKLAELLPGPATIPLAGNALAFACEPEQLLERVIGIISPYEDVTPMRVWMGPALHVVITAPRDIEVVLNSHQATNKGMAYKFFFPFIGDGLISGSGKRWRSHRKMISHSLNPRTLLSYVEVFDRRSRILIEKLMPFADGRLFDILEKIEACTIDIVSETVMGCDDINAQENIDQEFIRSTAEMYKIVHDRMMKIWLYPDWIFRMTGNYERQRNARRIIHNFTEKCINRKRQDLTRTNYSPEVERISILERVLVANNLSEELTEEELGDEIYTVYIAAQDTLALTSSFATLMLAIHPEIQEKARTEVENILSDNEPIVMEDLNAMKYLESCIRETLRLFPIAPLMVRRLGEELELDNCTLPKNCQVVVASYVTQRSKKYWKNPDKFIPERFSMEESSERHPFSFVPFSAGPMGCIGQKFALTSLKTLLANLLRNFKIKTSVKMQDIRLKTDISIRSVDGYKISLEALPRL